MYQNKLNGAVRVAFWMLYALLFCYYGSCLSSLYSIPMSYDPIIYGIVGNGWMEGLMPYRDLFDQKGRISSSVLFRSSASLQLARISLRFSVDMMKASLYPVLIP